MELDPHIAAHWFQQHNIPPLPPDLHKSLQEFADRVLQAIHADPDVPPPEVRVYYQSMKFILLTAMSQQSREA
jgi:uncharacterized protein (DUF2267 family)